MTQIQEIMASTTFTLIIPVLVLFMPWLYPVVQPALVYQQTK